MRKLPQSNYHPIAFREVSLPSGKVYGVWADTLLELAANDDWRVVSTFSREVALDSFLLLLSWDGANWANTGATMDRASDLQLAPTDRQAFQEWVSQAITVAWFAELKEKAFNAVTRLQMTASTALTQAVQQPVSIFLEIGASS